MKSIIPKLIRNELAINRPIMNRGIDALEQIFTTGTIEFLKIRGEYDSWCCIACPTSWAATPIEAMLLLP